MGTEGTKGPLFLLEDLRGVMQAGHELGCHTFGHCDSWTAAPGIYESSIIENRRALSELLPGASFQTFAYPLSAPWPAVKRVAGRHFLCCRGGGRRRVNVGTADLDALGTFFLKQS